MGVLCILMPFVLRNSALDARSTPARKDIRQMDAYAVVETGGKQYRVSEGSVVEVEKLDVEVGQDIELTSVLAVSDGESLKIGTPVIDGAKVVMTVTDQKRGPKVVNFKKKRRKGYKRKVGHRQSLTVVKVKQIA